MIFPKKEFANSVVPESANRDLEGKLGEKHRVVGHFFYREQLKSKNAARIPHFSYRKVGRIDEREGKVDECTSLRLRKHQRLVNFFADTNGKTAAPIVLIKRIIACCNRATTPAGIGFSYNAQ